MGDESVADYYNALREIEALKRAREEAQAWKDRFESVQRIKGKYLLMAENAQIERDTLRQQLTDAHAEIGELHERVRAQARALEGMQTGERNG